MTSSPLVCSFCFFFFFNDTATTEIYTLSLHDALPIWSGRPGRLGWRGWSWGRSASDRKSTRLNSSHVEISYAVFCLKKKKKQRRHPHQHKNQQTPHQHNHPHPPK